MPVNRQFFEPLDSDKIKALIEPENLHGLGGVDVFDSINSTNTYLLECAKTGMSSGWVCLAEQQTKGRGRQGRVWFSPRGASISCSLLWHFSSSQADMQGLSLAVAVMVTKALRQFGILHGIELKWPNDILFAGRKLAGILLESLPEQGGKVPVVIGIGLNVLLPQDHPEVTRWIDVTEITGKVVSRNILAAMIINALLADLLVFQQRGLSAFIEEWRAHDVMQGKEVTVHIGTEKVTGVMQGINERCELILKTAAGEVKRFQCGEVSCRLS